MSEALDQILKVLRDEAIADANALIQESKGLMQREIQGYIKAVQVAQKDRDEAVAKRDEMRYVLLNVLNELDEYTDRIRRSL